MTFSAATITPHSRNLQQGTGREILVNGQPFLFFGGTAYLGLNQHPEFMALVKEGIDRYGLNNGTSRTNNIQLGVYEEAEAFAAQRFGFQESILVSSGYLAAQLAVRTLTQDVGPNQILFSPSCHPALWLNVHPGMMGDFDDWAVSSVAYINQRPEKHFVLISNTVDNVQPRRFDFTPFLSLHPSKSVHFLLDDSHGIGVFHPSETAIGDFKQNLLSSSHSLTVVASMAKGYGIDAGAIFSDSATIAKLKKTGYFVGASPSAPAFLHAFINGEGIYEAQWQKLNSNIHHFCSGLKDLSKWMRVPNYPVFLKPGVALFEILAENGMLITSFPYPNPDDPALDRIVISAAHEVRDIDKLLGVLNTLA